MAKVETFKTSRSDEEIKEVAMLLSDSAEELVKMEQNLYHAISDDAMSALLKVARNKVQTLRTQMLAMLDMVGEMSVSEEYLAGADADDIESEVVRRTDIFSENEI